jgi:hypothetical protein
MPTATPWTVRAHTHVRGTAAHRVQWAQRAVRWSSNGTVQSRRGIAQLVIADRCQRWHLTRDPLQQALQVVVISM